MTSPKMDDRLTREQIKQIRAYSICKTLAGAEYVPLFPHVRDALCDLALSALRQDSSGGVLIYHCQYCGRENTEHPRQDQASEGVVVKLLLILNVALWMAMIITLAQQAPLFVPITFFLCMIGVFLSREFLVRLGKIKARTDETEGKK